MNVKTDAEGYLLNLQDWNTSVATEMAAIDKLTLTADHWTVINFLREFYRQYKIIPAMRVVIKELKNKLSQEKDNSSYLQQLFPSGFFKQGCKIAGLPKPTRCI